MDLEDPVSISVENVGGIDETYVEFSPGVTVLAGRNATNRTSLLQAVMAAVGSEGASLKADADDGRVELTLGDETYTRTLTRTATGVSTNGDPYLDDPELADLFAFLLRNNEARRAVERGDDLRDLIMRPVDTDSIQREIDRLVRERDRLDDELDELDELADERTRLERRRNELEAEIESLEDDLADVEAEIDATEVEVPTAREEQSRLEEKLDALRDARSDLEDVRYSLETERESLSSLRDEKADIEDELADLDDAGDVDGIERRLERLRGERESLDGTINDLQSVVQFNEKLLDGDDTVVEELAEDGGAVTDQLVDAGTVTCWTCGTSVERERIEGTLDQLRSLVDEKLDRRSELADEIDDLQSERRTHERRERRRNSLERDLADVEDELEEREARVESLTADRDDLADRISSLEADVEELRDDAYDDLLDRHQEANELEFELERKREELADVEEELAEVTDRLGDRGAVEARREEVADDLADVRMRVDRIESDAVEAFNTHMENVLDTLDYANISRIWIERTEGESERRSGDDRSFDLHVVRETADGTVYEDTVDHLSESEREVTGLVFALAGFLAHDVYETVPFVVMDSLEAIDSERIAALVEYVETYADNLLVALLPEDAAALDDGYERVTSI